MTNPTFADFSDESLEALFENQADVHPALAKVHETVKRQLDGAVPAATHQT
jgi:hypothetical protein